MAPAEAGAVDGLTDGINGYECKPLASFYKWRRRPWEDFVAYEAGYRDAYARGFSEYKRYCEMVAMQAIDKLAVSA